MINKLSILVSLILLLGCGNGKKEIVDVLTVTIEPQRFFLEKIVGDKFSVKTLVPPGTSPETFEPTPSAMIDLSKSKAYFKVGFLGYENAWSESLEQNNPELKIVDCSMGIDLLYGDHSHAHGDDSHGHHHVVGADPHVWSSTKNAVLFAQNMLEGILSIDAENADYYRSNFEKLLTNIHQTDSVIEELLTNIPSRSFIIYHPALSYFAQDYNLVQHSVEFEGKQPSPKQMKQLVDLAKTENIRVVFIQQEFDIKNAEVIAREIGTQAQTINPLAYEWDEELIKVAQILSHNQ